MKEIIAQLAFIKTKTFCKAHSQENEKIGYRLEQKYTHKEHQYQIDKGLSKLNWQKTIPLKSNQNT